MFFVILLFGFCKSHHIFKSAVFHKKIRVNKYTYVKHSPTFSEIECVRHCLETNSCEVAIFDDTQSLCWFMIQDTNESLEYNGITAWIKESPILNGEFLGENSSTTPGDTDTLDLFILQGKITKHLVQ